MEIWVKNTLNGLVPMYESDYDSKKKLKYGAEYLVQITLPRNIKFHRKMFALYNLVLHNQERYSVLDDLRKDLTIEAGYYTERYDIHGELRKEAKSISFGSMQEDEFSELYSRTVDVIVKHFHFDREDIKENIEQFF